VSTRTWAAGAQEPSDHPSLVDNDGITWTWDPDNCLYERQKITHYPHPDGVEHRGVILGSPVMDWDEILEEYGPMREATVDEARELTVVYSATPLGELMNDPEGAR